ncbi:MAG: SMP-30/gluconolactonase/LRE family protein [Alphaproteobacteria bacterium]|nr:SMP-30/gluconolactonase/LRE family protein [Alphaproteobacteria bacterium]
MTTRGQRTVTTGLRFPEGPVAMADGSVVLVEIAAAKLTRVFADGRKETIAQMTGGPNGAALGPDGKMYVCNNGGFDWIEDPAIGGLRPRSQATDYSGGRIERVDLATGAVETLYTRTDKGALRGPNDIVFDGTGGFWFTDLGKSRARDRDHGGIYYARADGSLVKEVVHPFLSPNGIALSPDDRTLYVAETEGGRLWAFDIVGPGEVRRAPWPSPHGGRFLAAMQRYQRFDSMAVEADGNVCVATLATPCITVIAPDGRVVEQVETDDIMTTNICFGGPGLKTAYITLSGSGRLVAMDWPRAGLPLHYLNKRT